ncbi:hypothetical protein BJF90_34765 [Pseudonocardia sp. CNS-004]|nr:hypothetical protein BJF90_34765 [Pseudonocardia sp. CNS-004]
MNTVTGINAVGSDTVTDVDGIEQCLDQARDAVTAAASTLGARVPSLTELHAAAEGAIQVSTALADLVAIMMRQAPGVLDRAHQGVLNEVLADLRAVHGCLTTGPLLLAPARDALHLLGAHRHAGTTVPDAHNPALQPGPGPARDGLGKLCPGRGEPIDDVRVIHGVADVPEADPPHRSP